MSQDSNNKNLDKNFKLMAMSAVVLLILFVYTMYKSNSHIQGNSYYVGIIFLFVLLFLSLLLKMKQEKVRAFFNKNKTQTSAFDNELAKSKEKRFVTFVKKENHCCKEKFVTTKEIVGY